MTSWPQQQVSSPHGVFETMRLIPPGSEEFKVYGNDETTERARAWAFQQQLHLVEGVAKCAHGLYGFAMCPVIHRGCGVMSAAGAREMDHVNLWAPRIVQGDMTRWGTPFLMASPYVEKPVALRAYAEAHGLRLSWQTAQNTDVEGPDREGLIAAGFDLWYGYRSIAVRLEVPDGWPLWPIERMSILLQITQPAPWPEE